MAQITTQPTPPPVPEGWFIGGSNARDYEVGRDTNVRHGGRASGYIRGRVSRPAGSATLMQTFLPDVYRGKRLRLTAFVRTERVERWASMWMRVDGPVPGRYLQFDNMHDRPITGTIDWHEVEIVLDVPPNSTMIAFGVLLSGPGQVWVDDFVFNEVDERTAITGRREVRNMPDNLDFER
jgi:hypothetical protein